MATRGQDVVILIEALQKAIDLAEKQHNITYTPADVVYALAQLQWTYHAGFDAKAR